MSNKSRICSRCGVVYDNAFHQCPACKKLNPKVYGMFIGYIIILVIIIFPYGIPEILSNFYNEHKVAKPVASQQEAQPRLEIQEIDLRPMSELSYLPVSEILEKRTKYVNVSKIFGDLDYQPSPEVFKIEDGLPWISAEQLTKYGTDNNPDIGEGLSIHSLSINNPELLFVILMNAYTDRDPIYASEADYMLPYNMTWNKTERIIRAKFHTIPFFEKNHYASVLVQLEDANARDMGYKWAYCYAYNNILFKDEESNFSKDVYELQGYYHKGYSCGLESGCNNYSPNQPALQIYLTPNKGYVFMKLWKEKPNSKHDRPDLIYKMYFK